MKRPWIAMKNILIVSFAVSMPSASVLSDAVSQMQPRSWRPISTQYEPEMFDVINPLFSYSNDALWDEQSEQVLFFGRNHGRPYKFIAYDVQANQWREKKLPFSGHGGHTYDNITMDFKTHQLYWFTNDDEMFQYTPATDRWTTLSQNGSKPKTGHGMALEYFPEMGGLFHVYQQGSPLSFFDLGTNTWQKMPSSPAMGFYHNLAEYSRVHNVMLFGAGNDGSRLLHKMDASGKITQIAEPPVDVGINRALLTADPVTGDFLVLSGQNPSDSLYVYHVSTDSWETLGPNPGINNQFAVVAQISTYGVLCFLSNASWPVLLYKYANAPVAVETLPTNKMKWKTPFSIAPSPAHGVTTIRIKREEKKGIQPQLRILNINGKLIQKISPHLSSPQTQSSYSWNTSGLTAGAYIVQGKVDNKIISQKVLITQ